MKKLILFLIGLALAAPSTCFAIQKFERTQEIKMDESGGYAESQRDHHAKRSKQLKQKSSPGYYDGSYHNKSSNFKPGEWQFVGSSNKATSKKKNSYKKVKETE